MSAISLTPVSPALSLAKSAESPALKNEKPTLKALRGGVEAQEGSASSSITQAREQAKLKKTCQDFESVFVNYMLSKMRESVPKDDLMGSSNGEEIYRGMLDEELSKQIAASGGVGLASMLYRELGGTKR